MSTLPRLELEKLDCFLLGFKARMLLEHIYKLGSDPIEIDGDYITPSALKALNELQDLAERANRDNCFDTGAEATIEMNVRKAIDAINKRDKKAYFEAINFIEEPFTISRKARMIK